MNNYYIKIINFLQPIGNLYLFIRVMYLWRLLNGTLKSLKNKRYQSMKTVYFKYKKVKVKVKFLEEGFNK